MLGKHSGQRGLWEADSLKIDHVGRGSFYGLLASMRGQLFRDEDFAEEKRSRSRPVMDSTMVALAKGTVSSTSRICYNPRRAT